MKNEELVLRKRAHSFLDVVPEIKVRSLVTLNRANAMIVRIKGVRAEVIKFFADPIDKAAASKRAAAAAHQAIVAKRDEVEEPLISAEMAIKGKVKKYLLAEEERREAIERENERKRREALEKAEELRGKGHHEEADDVEDFVPTKFVPPAPRMEGVQSREKWRYRVIDPNKIPRRYLMIDSVKINQEVTLKKGATKIPGIEAYKDMIIAGSRG